MVFISLFFAATFLNKINIGIRYILPVYPFLYLFTALAVAYVAAENLKRKAAALSLVAALALYHMVSSWVTYPSYISYFNEFIGSSRKADTYLIDSNLDWGQDLKRLGMWVNDNNIPYINVIYFGGGEPAYYLGARANILRTVPLPIRPGYYAVSRHLYRLSSYSKGKKGMIDLEAYFRNAGYVSTIGNSIYIFKY